MISISLTITHGFFLFCANAINNCSTMLLATIPSKLHPYLFVSSSPMYPQTTKMSIAMSNMLSPAPSITGNVSPHDTFPNNRFAMTLTMGLKNERSEY